MKSATDSSTEREALESLGYLATAEHTPRDAPLGVLLHDRERSAPGINYLTNAGSCSSQLLTNDGEVLRTWSRTPCHRWGNTVLLPSGDLLILHHYPSEGLTQQAYEMAGTLLRMTWEGEVLWERSIAAHHDVGLTASGTIVTLTFDRRMVPELYPSALVRDHAITVLDMNGEVLEEASLTDILLRSQDSFDLRRIEPRRSRAGFWEVKLIHSNSVEWMRSPRLAEENPLFALTNVLVTLRGQDAIVIIDWLQKKVVWSWGQGILSGPHDAQMLSNGHILVFDNGRVRGRSRIVEVDPVRNTIVWQYGGHAFFSPSRGSAQRLPNGNTLVSVSDSAIAFEVTASGELVWQLRNSATGAGGKPVAFARIRRFVPRALSDGRQLPEASID